MLVRWAGASGDFNPLHYDSAYVESAGLGQVIVHGALKRQWLIQLMTDWIGEQGFLKKFSCQYGGDGLSPPHEIHQRAAGRRNLVLQRQSYEKIP